MSAELPLSRTGRTATDVARLLAQEAGRIIMKGFGKDQDMQWKGRGNIVTEIDYQVEHALIEILASAYPDHAVLSEETAAHARSDGWLWVIDPLDGTRNYASGIPFFCTNIALCYQEEPLLALTYEPVRGEEFFALKGEGAYADGHPVRASDKDNLQASVLGVDMGYNDQKARYLLALLLELWPGMQCFRVPGSAALGIAYAAAGRYDLFVHHDLSPWDIAAGILLVREAGGVITDRDGGPVSIYSKGVIAGGPAVHADFLRLAAGHPWR